MTKTSAGRLVALLLVAAATARAEIRYRVTLEDPVRHRVAVEMTVPDVKGRLTVALPAWYATYQIRDFVWRLSQLEACSGHERLQLEPLDQQTWAVQAQGSVVLRYRMLWDDEPPFGSVLDPRHAFFNLAELLLYVPERRREPVAVEFAGLPAGWHAAAELEPDGPAGFRAPGYDALVDAPVELGTFDAFSFPVGTARVRVVVDGGRLDHAQVQAALERIVGYQTRLMGEMPCAEYLFIYHLGGRGGMEHACSTAISLGRPEGLPGVSAHEFFHLWNVKRIRPQSLEPVDYEHPMWTRALWFAEGVTSTYGALTLVRSGLWTPEQYLEHLGEQITELQARPARQWQSAEESSLDAWLEKYPGYFRPERSISYYNKGELLGVLLDVQIREATENRRSLDDVLRWMNEQFAHRGRFYRDSADVRAAVEQVAGRDFGGFFERYVAGTEEIPWAELLRPAGLGVEQQPVERADVGMIWQPAPGGEVEVVSVEPGGAAAAAGLMPGDRLVAPAGASWPASARQWAATLVPGQQVALTVRRGAQTLAVTLRAGSLRYIRYRVVRLAEMTPRQRRILDGLLAGRTD
jgi:predicted metalloprotease with PDZ domain